MGKKRHGAAFRGAMEGASERMTVVLENREISGEKPARPQAGARPGLWARGVTAVLILIACACSWNEPYSVSVGAGPAMSRCERLATVAAIADMGAFQIHTKYQYDAQESVLRQAEMMAATHVVWVGDYPFAAAADAYRCLD
jgi:hypothetical protein